MADKKKTKTNWSKTNPKEFEDFDNLVHHPERLLLQGKCDDVCKKLVDDIGWTGDLNKLIP